MWPQNKSKSAINVDGDQLSKAFQLCFGEHVLELNQEVAFDFQGTKFVVMVESLDHAQFGKKLLCCRRCPSWR